MQTRLVQGIGGHIEQRCHLVNERAGSARTRAVHPFVHGIAEKEDLRVLPAQLNDGVRIGLQSAHDLSGSPDLLHKRDPGCLGKAHSGGARHGSRNGRICRDRQLCQCVRRITEHCRNGIADLRIVACIAGEYRRILAQHNDFCGGGANVHAQ